MLAPPMLAVVAIVLWVGGAAVWIAATAAALALVLGVFVVFDFTLSVTLDEEGINRRCLGRTHTLRWAEIDRMFNPRRRGLVVVTDGSYHILIDRRLDPSELDLFAAQARLHDVDYEI